MMDKKSAKIVVKNNRAYYDYFLSEFTEAGIVLQGTEIKSIRNNGANITDSHIIIKNQEMHVLNMHIAPYEQGNIFNHEPRRTRKLLLHRTQINKFAKSVNEKGYTIVVTKVYFSRGKAKLEIALGKGKKHYDKREVIKRREDDRKIEKAIKGQKVVD
jgi:SsrA-binding protein